MKKNKQYQIDIFGLKLGTHDYEFEFTNSLFEDYENSIVEFGKGQVKLTLEKKETLISLDFEIIGELELTCDRSLELFKYPVNIHENLILKYGKKSEEGRDDLWVIPSSQESINIRLNIYTFLTVAIPMKKLHPKFENSDEEEGLELVYSSDEEDSTEEEKVDPRWTALKSIKKNLEN